MIRSLPHESVQRTVLANGLTVLVHEDHSAPVVAVVTYVKAGYFDEPDDVVGIAHVLEHMYFKGTPSRGVGEIAKQTKASGGSLNAATIYDHTSYYAVLPTAGFDTGLEIQADAYAHSVIDGDELRRELEVIIEEAKRKEDNPGAVTTETRATLTKNRRVNIRVSTQDVSDIQARAVEEGIPYQTLMASVLHKFATGQLVEKGSSLTSRSRRTARKRAAA